MLSPLVLQPTGGGHCSCFSPQKDAVTTGAAAQGGCAHASAHRRALPQLMLQPKGAVIMLPKLALQLHSVTVSKEHSSMDVGCWGNMQSMWGICVCTTVCVCVCICARACMLVREDTCVRKAVAMADMHVQAGGAEARHKAQYNMSAHTYTK